MAHADYAGSVYPDKWQVLGVELKPFSLGHYFKLRKLGCTFVSDTAEEATIKDLILGVIVCSMGSHHDPEQDPFWRWLNNSDRSVKLWFWNFTRAQKLTQAEFEVLQWGKRVGKTDFVEKAKLFAQYLSYYQESPGFYEGENTSNEPAGGHWSHSLYHALTSKCGYSPIEAFNAPMRRCLCDFFKLLESEGGGRLMTPEEIEFANAGGDV